MLVDAYRLEPLSCSASAERPLVAKPAKGPVGVMATLPLAAGSQLAIEVPVLAWHVAPPMGTTAWLLGRAYRLIVSEQAAVTVSR
ncbi:MAG: hypothetical protein PHS14_15365 [Elusimicrobia bacterium]|nr:hypothetical protein [Elusimicrobiota bacterium]